VRAESSQRVVEVEKQLSSSVRSAVPFFHRQAGLHSLHSRGVSDWFTCTWTVPAVIKIEPCFDDCKIT
jgi:hypothetical protein